MKVIVTGVAGFIGSQVALELLKGGHAVAGVDHLGGHGDTPLKKARLARVVAHPDFEFAQIDFADGGVFAGLAERIHPEIVIHLGAQPGVRHSLEHPEAYTHSNLVGFANVLEACRRVGARHFVYASSSSVYGAGARPPFREDSSTDRPVSYYGATKKANEVLAHSYAVSHGLATTGLRFFSVYGPWGRSDMAPTLFARAICEGRPLKLFNQGRNLRDFTYVDDIVTGIMGVLNLPAAAGTGRIFNLGHNRPVETLLFVRMLEELLGRRAVMELVDAQPAELPVTCADLTCIRSAIGFRPKVSLEDGLRRFVAWFREYYGAELPSGVETNPPLPPDGRESRTAMSGVSPPRRSSK